MKIQKIFIYEFGGLKDLLIMPEDGITLVRGGNESGKSTVMSFISFIFYGLFRSRYDLEDKIILSFFPNFLCFIIHFCGSNICC